MAYRRYGNQSKGDNEVLNERDAVFASALLMSQTHKSLRIVALTTDTGMISGYPGSLIIFSIVCSTESYILS